MATVTPDSYQRELYRVPGQHEYEGILYLPITPKSHLENIRKIRLTSEDILIATFSKSGTTWLQEITYLISNGGDIDEARSQSINKRVPFIDCEATYSEIAPLKSPKLIKTHLRLCFFRSQILNDRPKVVVIMRNPKDTLVSFYHFYKSVSVFGPFPGTWNDFFELVRRKSLIYGDWFDHVLDWWQLKTEPNALFLKYEDLKMNPRNIIRKLAQFMERELSEDTITKIVEATSFQVMKKNPAVNCIEEFVEDKQIIRQGKVGDWKNYFTVAQNEYFDNLYEEKMKDSGLEFIFELNE